MVRLQVRDVWRSASTECGALSAMTSGAVLMLRWLAHSSATHEQVRGWFYKCFQGTFGEVNFEHQLHLPINYYNSYF